MKPINYKAKGNVVRFFEDERYVQKHLQKDKDDSQKKLEGDQTLELLNKMKDEKNKESDPETKKKLTAERMKLFLENSNREKELKRKQELEKEVDRDYETFLFIYDDMNGEYGYNGDEDEVGENEVGEDEVGEDEVGEEQKCSLM
jgi:hypothetical protein